MTPTPYRIFNRALQTVLDASATNSGVLLLPLAGGLFLTAGVTGQLITYFGRYKVFTVIGTVVAAAGFWLLHTMSPATTHLEAAGFMVVAGLGLGFVMPTLTIAAQNAVERDSLGAATSTVTFTRSLGAGLGVAVLGAILTNQLTGRLASAFPNGGGAGKMASGSIDPSKIHALPSQVQSVVQTAIANSLDTVFLAALFVLAVAFIAALFLPRAELDEEALVEVGEGGTVPDDVVEDDSEPVAE